MVSTNNSGNQSLLQKIYKLVPIIGTIMESKENKVLSLFFEYPTKEWHFEDVVKESGIARSKADLWLKKFMREKLIKRVKRQKKMPYYTSAHDTPPYRNEKRLFALRELYDSGLLNYLVSLPEVQTVILFGSFCRSDWYYNSDIDVFIYGNPKEVNVQRYQRKLHRPIQVFTCQNKDELKKLGNDLIRNIVKGYILKGDVDFIRVDVND